MFRHLSGLVGGTRGILYVRLFIANVVLLNVVVFVFTTLVFVMLSLLFILSFSVKLKLNPLRAKWAVESSLISGFYSVKQ